MTQELVLLLSMAASLATGALMWWWLRGALREMLDQLCEKPGSTNFWARYTLLMLLIAPLLLVVLFSPSQIQDSVQVIRQVTLSILFGHFVTFALVGRSLIKAVREGLARNKTGITAVSPEK